MNSPISMAMHRTTFALDDNTIRRIKRLAATWRVSQAEVVRRAIEQAERLADEETRALTERLQSYHARGGLNAAAAESYLEEVAGARAYWGRNA